MTRPLFVGLALISSALSGCDNRTQDGRRWNQIAEIQKTDKAAQPFTDAEEPWSSAEYHSGLSW